MLDNRYALLFIRGERPVKDLKYDILKHPNVSLTTDGKAVPYQHGTDPLSFASISINLEKLKEAQSEEAVSGNYILLSDEEIYEFMEKQSKNKKQEENHEKHHHQSQGGFYAQEGISHHPDYQ